MFETGHFATLWKKMAEPLRLVRRFRPRRLAARRRSDVVERKLREDRLGAVKAVMVVHNETSTGVASRIPLIRQAIDRARHGAMLMVDTISSLASMEYRHAEWGVDVTVCCSQKASCFRRVGLQRRQRQGARSGEAGRHGALLLGLGRHAEKTTRAASSPTRRDEPSLWIARGARHAARGRLHNVLARHARHAEATRRAVLAWDLEILCVDPAEHSNVLTAVMMPKGHDADAFRATVLERFDMSLGTGLAKLAGRVFSHRPPRRLERSDAAGNPRRSGNGTRRGWSPAPRRRHPGSDEVSPEQRTILR